MNISIQYTVAELKALIVADLQEKLGTVSFKPENLTIEVKSSQNYKSEWESAHFRARYQEGVVS